MAVNFNILQGIEPPRVVASLPVAQQQPGVTDQIGALGQGLLSGALQGQQMQINNQNMKKNEMDIEQARQMNPIQLQNAKAIAGTNQIQFDEAQRKQDLFNYARQQAQGNYTQYMEALGKGDAQNGIQGDPAAKLEAQSNLGKMQQEMGKAGQEMAKGDVQQQQAISSFQIAGGKLAGDSVQAAMDPQTGQVDWNLANQKYQTQLDFMRKTYGESIIRPYPAELTPGTFGNLMFLGNLGAIRLQELQASNPENKTADMKNAERIAQLENTKRTPQQESELQSLKQQTSKARMYPSPEEKVQEGLIGLDIEDVKGTAEAAKESDTVIAQAEIFKKLNKQFKTGMFAETGLAINKAYTALTGKQITSTPFGEALQSKGMDFVFQRIKDTKGAISDKEMESFEKASPGLRNSQAGNELLLDIVIGVENRKKELAKQQRQYLREHNNLDGFKEQWSKYTAQNPIIDPKRLEALSPKGSQPSPQPTGYTQEQIQQAREILKQRGIQ